MSIKNIFKALSITFKRYRKYLTLFMFATSIIFFALNYLFSLLNLAFIGSVLSFVLLFPILLSFKNICLKCVDRKDLENRDFYFGFHNFKNSVGIGSLAYNKGILMGLLGSLAGMFTGSMIFTWILIMNEGIGTLNSYINSGDYNALIEYISTKSYMGSMADIIIILSIIGFILFFCLFGLNKAYTLTIMCDKPMSPFEASKRSETYTSRHHKSFIKYNLLFGLFLSAIFVLYLETTMILINNGVNSNIVSPLTMLLILIYPSTYVLVCYELGLTHAYVHYYRKETLDDSKDNSSSN